MRAGSQEEKNQRFAFFAIYEEPIWTDMTRSKVLHASLERMISARLRQWEITREQVNDMVELGEVEARFFQSLNVFPEAIRRYSLK